MGSIKIALFNMTRRLNNVKLDIPLQPTKEMIDSAIKELSQCKKEKDSDEDTVVFIWQAMVSEFNMTRRLNK